MKASKFPFTDRYALALARSVNHPHMKEVISTIVLIKLNFWTATACYFWKNRLIAPITLLFIQAYEFQEIF